MKDQLQALRAYSTVVADTGDFESMREFTPTDATTNPSLILRALQEERYQYLLAKILRDGPEATPAERQDRLLVAFGLEILRIVPGRVSTEIDARLSFDVAASVARARQIIALYEAAGQERERVLIKLAATWEGICAARQLQAEGINCNLTLIFSLVQAVACAQAGVRLISPFVGRIYDWHKKAAAGSWDEAAHAYANDPGVRSVAAIYNYFKAHGIDTQVMGASFRNIGQIRALAGCDLLTIAPSLLAELAQAREPLEPALSPEQAAALAPEKLEFDEAGFRFALNQDAMASEKLAEGIRLFVADGVALDALIQSRLA